MQKPKLIGGGPALAWTIVVIVITTVLRVQLGKLPDGAWKVVVDPLIVMIVAFVLWALARLEPIQKFYWSLFRLAIPEPEYPPGVPPGLTILSARWYCPTYKRTAFIDCTKEVQAAVDSKTHSLKYAVHQDFGLGDPCEIHGAGIKKGKGGKGHSKSLLIEYEFRNSVIVHQDEEVIINCNCPQPEKRPRQV